MLNSDFIDEEEYEVNIYADIERNLRSYSGFVSLLRELIQNSDDSSIDNRNIEVEVFFLKDRLVLKNNTAFTQNDWKKIKEIGSRNKEGNSQKTGRFGIGFTSVFKICDNLNIHSANLSKNLNLNLINTNKKWRTYSPEKTKYTNGEEITEFEFFWRTEDSEARKQINAEIITPNKIDFFVEEALNNIRNDVHFLNNLAKLTIYKNKKIIQEIIIERETESLYRDIARDIKTITIDGNPQKKIIYRIDLEEYFQDEYKDKIARRKPFWLSVAFDCSTILKGRIFCTLPTEMNTGFAFDINCDFQPDQNRKQLIFDKDDKKGEYNLKIFGFIPDLLCDIIDDLKEELPLELFYEVLSSSESNGFFEYLYEEFIDSVKEMDFKIINIDNIWYPISKARFSYDSDLLKFLTRIHYPTIPDNHLEYSRLFNILGVKTFELEHLIDLIEEEIPNEIDFENSIFKTREELYAIYSFIERNYTKYHENELQNLNIFLTKNKQLHNNNNSNIIKVPKELDLIKDDLPIKQIDDDLLNKYGYCLRKLGVIELNDQYLIEIISQDFANEEYPINLSKAQSYINSKEKLLSIISFIQNRFEQYNEYKKAKKESAWFKEGELIRLNDKRFKKFESDVKSIFNLPIALSEDQNLYPLKNKKVYNLNSKYKKGFGNLIGLKNIDADIRKVLYELNLLPILNLSIIIDLFTSFLDGKNQEADDNHLILLYQLISEPEQKRQLDKRNIDRLRRIRIFRNSKNEPCSLNNNGKEMMLQGNYPIPDGISIDDMHILNETLLNNVPDFPKFKKQILESLFDVKKLTFGTFIRYYFEEIFNQNDVQNDDKLKLVDKLNSSYLELENEDSYPKIKEVLLKSNLVFCNDRRFHCPSKDTIFFKCEEFDVLFGSNYLYPDYENIAKYDYLFEQLGVNETLDEERIIEYIVNSINLESVSKSLIERMKKMFIYINKHWDNFDNKHKFNGLSNLKWLPASDNSLRLYEPTLLYLQNSGDQTQNTKPFLSEIKDILYLDIKDALLRETVNSSSIKREFVKIIGLNNVEKLFTHKIIENLKLLSLREKPIRNPLIIYSELNKRAEKDPHSVDGLKEFNSIYIKYEDEEKPRYFSTSNVFKEKNVVKLYGVEYIGYLPPEYITRCGFLIENLRILDEPDVSATINILKKIELKYKKYQITSEDDIKIISNCLKNLNNKVDDYEFKEEYVLDLQQMHILCNNENQLISPKYAVLDDNSIISTHFEKKLSDRYIKFNIDFLNLFKKLEIKRISQIISKELINSPNIDSLKVNQQFTAKLNYFSKQLPRIRVSNEESTKQNGAWCNIDPDLKVYDFKDLEVLKYATINDERYEIKQNNASCYIVKDETVLHEIYVKGSYEEILNGLTNELFETIHPSLNRDFISTIHSLLKMDSYEEMDDFLTVFLHYPVLENKHDTVLDIEKNIEISYEDNTEDLLVENINYSESSEFEEENEVNIYEEKANKLGNWNESANIDNLTARPNEKNIEQSSEFEEENEMNKSQEKANKLGYQKENTKIGNLNPRLNKNAKNVVDDFIGDSFYEEEAMNPASFSSQRVGSGKSLDQTKDKGRTKSPTEETDFLEEVEKQFATNNNSESILLVEAIDENLEPMSLEEEQEFDKAVSRELSDEIKSVSRDSKRREYTKHLNRIKDSPSSKYEVKNFYDGKCQICGYTFLNKSNENHCIITSFLEKTNKGIRHPANFMCLCPNHSALLKYGKTRGLDKQTLSNLKDNKIPFTAGTTKYEIKYNPVHFKMLKVFLKSSHS